MRKLCLLLFLVHLFASCSVSKKLGRSAQKEVLSSEVLKTAHVGISVFEPATGKTWFDYQGNHYFVPASNTKIPTCYAAMKYLGDSLVGLRYNRVGSVLTIKPSGDPTFLHPEFSYQPTLNLLKDNTSEILIAYAPAVEPLGSGWSWNDYDQAYMAERSVLPIYGNVTWIADKPFYPKHYNRDTIVGTPKRFGPKAGWVLPSLFAEKIYFDTAADTQRKQWENQFYVRSLNGTKQIPFVTDNFFTAADLLKDVTGKKVGWGSNFATGVTYAVFHSQPTDSLLNPMMHRSDNFFAEQSLLMVSNERLGYMNDEKIIDTLLKTDLKDLPQKPRWVDGSGLSRYNLFSPQDFVFILNKMKNEFGMARIKNIFATGGEGTLSGYFKTDSTFIYAKTGTLSGVVALSGFLTTKKGRDLIFSVLVNNHNGSATEVRRAVEKFVKGIRERY